MEKFYISVLIDYSILLFHKFEKFLADSNFNVGPFFSERFRNRTFVVQVHSISDYVRAIKNFLNFKKLSFDEKKLILLLIGANFYGESGINIWQACCFFHRLPVHSLRTLVKFLNIRSGLLKNGIIMIQESDLVGASLSLQEIADFYNNRLIYLSPFFINSFFSHFVEGSYYGVKSYFPAGKYQDVDMLINDISNFMRYVFFLSSYYKVNFSSGYKKENSFEKGELGKYINKLRKNILASRLDIGLIEFLKKEKISNTEFVFLLYLIYKVVIKKESVISNVEEVLDRLTFYPSQIEGIIACFGKNSLFYREGFLVNYNEQPFYEEEGLFDEFSDEDEDFVVPDYSSISISRNKIYNLIFGSEGKNFEDLGIDKPAKVSGLKDNTEEFQQPKKRGLFEIITPRIKLDNIILEESVKNELLGAVDLTKAVEIMKEWGVKPNLSSASFSSVKILLYGPSGTGKTITAQALAGEAEAELFKVDASTLVSPWVGESSKNVRKVFREFYNYVQSSSRRVFLFMNEADQLLSARGFITQAADKEYNQMQNILLEELENFEGVFIATTNSPDLLDNAWNRRFNVKIKFDIPSYETRVKLWKIHLTDRMPLSSNIDIRKLAEYELAGGSIANVVYNVARKVALREPARRIISQEDFIEAIQQELRSHLGGKSSKVGF